MIEKRKISSLITAKISGEWGSDSLSSNAVNVIRTANFTNSGLITFHNIVKREIDINIVEKKKLINGDIIIEKSGGSPNQPVGRVVFFENPDNATYLCNNFTTILRPNKRIVNPKYLFYLLYNFYEKGQVLSFQNKTTGIINLKLDRYLDSEISFESDLETQSKVVAILDKAKALLEKREQTIKKCDDLLRATFLEMFGDVAINPQNLPLKPIKEFGEVITGNTPPRSDSENYNSQFIEWIKTDNIIAESPFLTKATEFLSEKGFSRARYVDENALFVACIAGSLSSIGRAAISDRRVAFNQQINAIVPFSDVSVHFLYWLFKVSAEYIQSFATSGMKKLLTKGKFEKIPLIKPDYQEQLKFENIALFYSQLRAKLKKHHIQAEKLLKSLSQQVFNERITINVDTELESLVNTIDIDKKDKENSISTLLNDVTYLQRLIDRLQAQEFADDEQYEKAKYILFRIMKEEPNLVKQKYDSEIKKIILSI